MPGVTWQMDLFPTVHQQFSTSGSLTNKAADNTGSYTLYALFPWPRS